MVRIKQRYLLLNILYPGPQSFKQASDIPDFLKFRAPTPQYVNRHNLLEHLKSHISSLFGDQGLGLCLSSLRVVYFSNATSTAILRVPRAHYHIVWAALSYMTEIPASKDRNVQAAKCVVRVVRVSGTIRKAQDELIRRSRRDVVEAKRAGKDAHDVFLDKMTGDDDASSLPSDHASLPSDFEDIMSASDGE